MSDFTGAHKYSVLKPNKITLPNNEKLNYFLFYSDIEISTLDRETLEYYLYYLFIYF